jgi:predicted transglutaminase-like protease
MTDYVDKHYQANDILRELQHEVKFLARAFYTTGNEKMSEELEMISLSIEQAKELYDESFKKVTNSYFQSTQESSANLLKAALAGAFVVTKEEGDKE